MKDALAWLCVATACAFFGWWLVVSTKRARRLVAVLRDQVDDLKLHRGRWRQIVRARELGVPGEWIDVMRSDADRDEKEMRARHAREQREAESAYRAVGGLGGIDGDPL